MKKLLLFLLFPVYSVAQTHFIDTNVLHMIDDNVNDDIAANTYYNSIDTCDISWNIINDSLPTEWEFSICFPDCHNIGVVNETALFLPNEKSYLNCHMYPNGIYGEGIVQMEIITNNLYRDTVTWIGTVSSISFTEELNSSFSNNKSSKIVDIVGREVKFKKNKLLFYLHDNGTVKKRIVLD